MKIRIRSTKTARATMLRTCVPIEVIDQIAGQVFELPKNTNKTDSFVVPAPLGSMNRIGRWNIAPECVEILSVEE